MPNDNVVEIEDLSFSYATGREVLSKINLQIPRGRVIGIMGQSGCGKTTLLRMIGGALKASQGDVRVFGQSMATLNQKQIYALRRRMSMLFQFGALFTDMSSFDNVAFQMREHTKLEESMIRDLVLMKLHAVGLRGAAELMPSELSGGIARRVALARAIALDPELMMYDEPFAGLDPISLNVIARLIRRLNDALRVTSIMVTYDVSESLKVVDYVYLLHDGVVQAEGTAQQLLASAEPFVVQFLHAQPTGPVAFHMQSAPYREDLGIA